MDEEKKVEEVSTETKKVKDPEKVLEIIVAIFLAVTALCTAWASWISSLHGGNQATNYTKSNNLSSEGNSMWNEASQQLMQDMLLWNQINEVSLNAQFAEEKGDVAEAEKYQYQLSKLMTDNMSEGFSEAVNWALEQDEEVSPFEKEGYLDSYYEDAKAVIAESDELLEQGKTDNANGDKYGLVTVIYSVVLFLLGIAGTFKNLPNRKIVVIAGIVGFVLGTIYMLTISLPTGFNLLSYFGIGN